MITVIQERDENGTYVLGAIENPPEGTNLDALWDEWMDTFDDGDGPDCDSDFVDWLVSDKGFQDAKADIHTIYCL